MGRPVTTVSGQSYATAMTSRSALPECGASIVLPAADHQRLVGLDAFGGTPEVLGCRLQEHHDSRHGERAADPAVDEEPSWWVLWDERGYEIVTLPTCPAESETDPGSDFCGIFDGHPGAHTWQLLGLIYEQIEARHAEQTAAS